MKTITLKKPLTIDSKEIAKIEVRSPGAGELRGLSLAALAELEVDTILKLMPRVTKPSISEDDAEDFSLPDLLAIGGALINPDGKTGNEDTTPKA